MSRFTMLAGVGAIVVLGASGKWTASLTGVGDSKLTGTATVDRIATLGWPMAAADSAQTPARAQADSAIQAAISIVGGTAGGSHAWHLHSGTCSAIGGVVGAAADYPMIKVGADGKGTANGKVRGALGMGAHVVAVHSGSAESPTIACGALQHTDMP